MANRLNWPLNNTMDNFIIKFKGNIIKKKIFYFEINDKQKYNMC